MSDKQPLSKRIRPNCEAAPWVIKEIEKLEARLEKVKACQRYDLDYFTDHWVEDDDGEHMLAADVLKAAGGE